MFILRLFFCQKLAKDSFSFLWCWLLLFLFMFLFYWSTYNRWHMNDDHLKAITLIWRLHQIVLFNSIYPQLFWRLVVSNRFYMTTRLRYSFMFSYLNGLASSCNSKLLSCVSNKPYGLLLPRHHDVQLTQNFGCFFSLLFPTVDVCWEFVNIFLLIPAVRLVTLISSVSISILQILLFSF